MVLTGKCEKDFKKWYKGVYLKQYPWWARPFGFYSFSNDTGSEKFGVIQDFADSLDFDIQTEAFGAFAFQCFVNAQWEGEFDTRTEAREVVVNKFNTMYNYEVD